MISYIETVLKNICDVPGVGGQPQIADAVISFLREYTDKIQKDAVGNVIATFPANKENAPTVLLEAHMDEIGFVVTSIDEKGFLKVAPCGGVDSRCLSATPVIVWADTALDGVFCAAVPHLQKGAKSDKALSAEELFVDVGLSADVAKTRIPIGTRVSFRSIFSKLQNTCVTSNALDNRAGVAAVLGSLHLLKGKELPCTVRVLFSVGEELGCRGAVSGTFESDADFAIVTDVSFAYTPYEKRTSCGEMGKGAMLGIAPTLSYGMTKVLLDIAKRKNIPHQNEVMGGKTGTDADVIGTIRAGIPTALLSIPLKYMHTPVEVVDINDIAAVSGWMAAYVEEGDWL